MKTVWNSILPYSYHWICMDCNKDLIYRNDFGTNYFCYCRFYYSIVFIAALCDCVGVHLVVIIGVGFILTTTVVILIALFILLHHCFVLFNTSYVWSCFQCYHCCFCVIVFCCFIVAFFLCTCQCHYYCISFFVITITIAACVLLWS